MGNKQPQSGTATPQLQKTFFIYECILLYIKSAHVLDTSNILPLPPKKDKFEALPVGYKERKIKTWRNGNWWDEMR